MRGAANAGHVLVLNGGSSAGKSTIGRALQSCLDGPWLLVGIDTLIWTLPTEMVGDPEGIRFTGGRVSRGPSFMQVHRGFRHAVAALALSGTDVILDEVLIDGAVDQRRWTEALAGLETCWVGVRWAPDVATAREIERGDRPRGGAALQARSVHEGVEYDLEVDTSRQGLRDVASLLLDEVGRRWSIGCSDPGARPPHRSSRSAWDRDGARSTAPWER